ncbi:MAG: hypothetical protein AAF202_00680 [Pseudomonadota bacterium]
MRIIRQAKRAAATSSVPSFLRLKRRPLASLLFAMFALPMSDGKGWQNLQFSKIPSNKVGFAETGLSVEVKKSASPLIFPLKEPKKVSSVSIKGKVNRLIEFTEKIQGEKGADDYVLRLGFVIPGKKTLNWAQRQIAADWVLKLFSLAPKDSGVDHIYFLNLGQRDEDRGREREHPLSDLIKEKNEWVIKEAGAFELTAEFEKPKKVAAIWISIDGDDTKASFTTQIDSIVLNPDLKKQEAQEKKTGTENEEPTSTLEN